MIIRNSVLLVAGSVDGLFFPGSDFEIDVHAVFVPRSQEGREHADPKHVVNLSPQSSGSTHREPLRTKITSQHNNLNFDGIEANVHLSGHLSMA